MPVLYQSPREGCAAGYPQPRRGEPWYGLPLTRYDNTFPLRCLAMTVQDKRRRRWHRHRGNNSQEAYLPTEVFVYKFRFFATAANALPRDFSYLAPQLGHEGPRPSLIGLLELTAEATMANKSRRRLMKSLLHLQNKISDQGLVQPLQCRG